jgi:hypothetical protein
VTPFLGVVVVGWEVVVVNPFLGVVVVGCVPLVPAVGFEVLEAVAVEVCIVSGQEVLLVAAAALPASPSQLRCATAPSPWGWSLLVVVGAAYLLRTLSLSLSLVLCTRCKHSGTRCERRGIEMRTCSWRQSKTNNRRNSSC